MRKLASIRKIEEIKPIEGADRIVAYRVDDWWVVDAVGKYSVGDVAIYLEVDSWVPTELAPFLSKGSVPREYMGVKGERLRTIKLRGQVSQGLLLPTDSTNEVGTDVSDKLGVLKWEAPISAQLEGIAKGTFPTDLIPKTDEDRIQNCFRNIMIKSGRLKKVVIFDENGVGNTQYEEINDPEDVPRYEVSMKLDGSSMTLFRWYGELRVASRNMELKINDDNAENSFVKMALELQDKIPDNYAFQGELMGPGIQGNRENFTSHQFFVFNIYNIMTREYMNPEDRRVACAKLGLQHVPILTSCGIAPTSVADALYDAEGPSINHPIREGVVWKSNDDPAFSFKVISNKFLLKGGN